MGICGRNRRLLLFVRLRTTWLDRDLPKKQTTTAGLPNTPPGYTVTLTVFRVTIRIPCKSKKYYICWLCVYSLSYQARNAHAPYYTVICGLCGCAIFFRIISQTARSSGEKFIEHKMCVLIFSTSFFRNISNSKNSARYYHKCTSVFM